jgi:predicted nucleic acid-binding Zn ribbon protein
MTGKNNSSRKKEAGDNNQAKHIYPLESIQDISSILDDYVSDSELGKKLKKFSIFNHWEDIVGKEINRKTRPQKLFKGILYIYVSDPGWANELSMMSEQLIERINSFIGEKIISQLRFKIMQ